MNVLLWVRIFFLAGCSLLLGLIAWLDQNRAGPVNDMERCNLLLSKAGDPAADVLMLGSSRLATAMDPVVTSRILTNERKTRTSVDRLAMGHSPLRAMNGLLDNYLELRGAPKVVIIEIMLLSDRSMENLANQGHQPSPEDYLYRRDINLLNLSQLMSQSAIAMPYSKSESTLNLSSMKFKGAALRTGALIYQLVRSPTQDWSLSSCGKNDWTRDSAWPEDFAFSYDEFSPTAPLAELIGELEQQVTQEAATRKLGDWQSVTDGNLKYDYDLEAPYREGENTLLKSMIERSLEVGAEVVLVPLPLYGHSYDRNELILFVDQFPSGVQLFDLYAEITPDIDTLWYDEAHLELNPTGRLSTALTARHLLQLPPFATDRLTPHD